MSNFKGPFPSQVKCNKYQKEKIFITAHSWKFQGRKAWIQCSFAVSWAPAVSLSPPTHLLYTCTQNFHVLFHLFSKTTYEEGTTGILLLTAQKRELSPKGNCSKVIGMSVFILHENLTFICTLHQHLENNQLKYHDFPVKLQNCIIFQHIPKKFSFIRNDSNKALQT